MNLFELFVKIDADTSQAEKGMKDTQKNSETLTNKIKVMSAQFESAQKNVDKLTQEFNESVKKTGATSKETQELAKKLDDAEKEAEQAKKALDGYNSELGETETKTEKAGHGLSNFASKLGKGLATAAKIGTAAVGAAAAGITALTTAAVNNYAEYEQLVGGVETLFGKSADTVMKYAESAYKTAGLSANEYMATVTSFSASLLQSVGGDTEKAADYANRALTDMSDNANKMGTSMELIQNAYNGFAKANYTMLDNLKLGYGGTKEEMARLIKEAAAMTDVQKELGIAVDATDMSFGNIVNAISVVQKNMKITGTTADEAGRTIAGSVQSMKSAWTNLVTGLADGNADIGKLVDNLVTTIVGDGTEANLGVLGNVMPAVKRALNGAARLVSELLPAIVSEIPTIISENLPILASAAVSIIQSLADGISQNSDLLVGAIFDAFDSIISGFPALNKSFTKLIPDLLDSILEELPGAIESIISALTDGGVIESLTEAVVEIVQSIADNLPNIIQAIVDAIPRITESVNNAILNNFPALLQAVIQIVLSIVQNLPSIIQMLVDQIGPIVSTIIQVLVGNLPTLIAGVAQIIWGLTKALPSLTISMFDSIISIFEGIGTGLVKAWPKFKEGISELWGKVAKWFGGLWEETKKIGGNIIDGIKVGIQNAWNNLKTWFKNLFGDLIGIAKKILGIASPSKVFKKIGGFTAEGFGAGFEDEFAHVKDDMEDALNFDNASVGINASIRKVGAGAAGMAYGGTSIGNITINVDGAKYGDEQSLASAIAWEIQNMTDRRAAVYA